MRHVTSRSADVRSSDAAVGANVDLRRLAAVAAVMGLVCVLLDRQHVASGAITYPGGAQPWWVPLQFFAAALAMLSSAVVLRRPLRGVADEAPHGARIAADAVAFLGAWIATCHLQGVPTVALLLLTAWWISRALLRPRWTIPFSLACAATGFAVEAIVSAAGVFAYSRPDLLGIARWLPAIYLHAALLAASLASWLEENR